MITEKLYDIFQSCSGISTDSRNITNGCMYFSLKGPRFNGHQFVENALASGASFAVIDEEEFSAIPNTILVENVLSTLQELASFHRQKFSFPVIGLTGSNGKTTTKELLHAVLSRQLKCYATRGNLNNHIGVPLTLLEIPLDAEMAIIEMGANHQKEIAFLSGIADPDYGIITNIGKAHLEGFGSMEGIKKGKKELFDHLLKKNGTAFVNADDPLIIEVSAGLKSISYGKTEGTYVTGKLEKSQPFVTVSWKNRRYSSPQVNTHLVGDYNFYNILAAICVGEHFGVSPESINLGLSGYIPGNNRSQWQQTQHNMLILDAYNANPGSMDAALNNFAKMETPGKIAILGDMLELGDEAPGEHQTIIKKLLDLNIPAFLVGPLFTQFSEGKFRSFTNIDEALKYFQQEKLTDKTILIKGSRGIALEKLIPVL